ncbi:MAG: hypothetical protein H6920_09825 [Sphingomonadaceae bacterium]|nr:hypothetical protein [Novosphingobium sp.]MCP5391903.1 hypothetical protein [Sphingomonadaceae bacterium]
MFGNEQSREAGKGIFMGSVAGFANVASFLIAFLLTPKVYGWSVEWVVGYVTNAYGEIIGELTYVIWGGTTFLAILFLSRATVGTTIMLGGATIAIRLM